MAIELTILGWSVILLLVHVVIQSGPTALELGFSYEMSARDAGLQPQSLYAGRARRALNNYLETYPGFVALAAAVVLANRTGGASALGAEIWLGARVVYLALYLLGIPYLRTLVWAVSIVGLLVMAVRLLS
jgi:uncharacterized MAPEG superfamily protein